MYVVCLYLFVPVLLHHYHDNHSLQILFHTKIYHPNIDEKGQVCLPIISLENWKPATKTDQGICVCMCARACVLYSVRLPIFMCSVHTADIQVFAFTMQMYICNQICECPLTKSPSLYIPMLNSPRFWWQDNLLLIYEEPFEA